MNSEEKQISFESVKSYSTLNELTHKTENIWFVCHGMGYLSRYFLKYFSELDKEKNYVIAPQAPSKYYMPPKFKHVGASWLTRENTATETENVLRYFEAIWKKETLPKDKKLIVLGYSQGVSVAMRFVARNKIDCDQLIIMSGGIPNELTSDDLNFLKADVKLIYGTKDQYLTEERISEEKKKFESLFGGNGEVIAFEGDHMVNVEFINSLVE